MIIDNVYVFTPDKAFVKGGIILDGDKIRQVYEEKDAPQLNGETDFIITYRISSATGKIFRYVKILFVCLVSFFGAAFSIMTFNNDVDMGSLFSQFYTLVTGKSSSGFTILEISYSIGIGLGVLIFFNHFGHLKLSDDPTPMQVQMRTYEDDVNRTLIEQAARTENPETDS